MRKLIIAVVFIFVAVTAWAAQPQTEDQKTIYALGALMSKQLSIFNLSADEYEILQQGMTDAAGGKTLAVEPEDYKQKINVLAQTRIQAAAQKQKDLAKPYLENAAKEEGAEKTASGLIYKQIKAGNGAKAKATDIVKVHYTGTFIDGKVFDSSVQRGQPVEFPLGQVIPCWTEGLSKMKVGGKAKLTCPSEIAYGDVGRPPVIAGGTTLVFEVELLEIKAPAKTDKKSATPAAKPKAKK
ncbi:MAG: FKBP-type peptidyl-prolyl cis-trans isomerase [Deltaproteobacteria bacterium]|nr:FKBP-type peptidyl-prolyl cis-trans isomerase [Deltaproteobacteria bacterium]